MPPLSEPDAIRALLETDRVWAAYALADLAPGFFEHCEGRGCRAPAPAICVHERLGFRRYMDFYEGRARLQAQAGAPTS